MVIKDIFLGCFIPLLGMLSIANCGKSGLEERVGVSDSVSSSTKREGGEIIVIPNETIEAFKNPMKGWRESISPGRDPIREGFPYPYGALIKEYMQWSKLEKTKDDGVEKIIAYSNHRWEGYEEMNLKVVPRVLLEWPNSTADPSISDDIRGTHWPDDLTTGDYTSEEFRERVRNLVKKLGVAWDNDSRVAFIQMGIIGRWAEHHTPNITNYWPPNSGGPHVPHQTYIPGIDTVLGNAFTKAFKNKKVLVRYAYDFPDYTFGVHWDSWGMPEQEVKGYQEMKKLKDRWRVRPIGGEITWDWGTYQSRYATGRPADGLPNVLSDQNEKRRLIGLIRDLHCTHLGGVTWADFTDIEFLNNASDLQRTMGYRFMITEFKYPARIESGKSFSVSFEVENRGSAPFYYDWPVELVLLHKDTKERVWGGLFNGVKISQWMPGDLWDEKAEKYTLPPAGNLVTSNFQLPEAINPGQYIVAIAILDPSVMKPSLRFAIENYIIGGYHPMGYIGISTDVDEIAISARHFNSLYSDKTLNYSN